jgi:hypothetical protein
VPIDFEKTWPPVTDCDCLADGFQSLTAKGIIAIENAGYTIDNGWDDFHDIVARDWKPNGKLKSVRGGCFYHQQDLEPALESGELYIAFGATSGDDSDGCAIAQEIVDTLKSCGLNASWSGLIRDRVCVKLDWKRRKGRLASTSSATCSC